LFPLSKFFELGVKQTFLAAGTPPKCAQHDFTSRSLSIAKKSLALVTPISFSIKNIAELFDSWIMSLPLRFSSKKKLVIQNCCLNMCTV